nr:MAG TPA: hypothetical protein [Caudoviricetes sp.]
MFFELLNIYFRTFEQNELFEHCFRTIEPCFRTFELLFSLSGSVFSNYGSISFF